MTDVDKLLSAGQDSLRDSEDQRRAIAEARSQIRADGLSAKKFSQVDAPQGLIELTSADGGRALIQNQGSLSLGAIQTGADVEADWNDADWPLPATGFEKPLQSERTGDGDEDTGDGDGDGDENTGEGNGAEPFCSTQILCYRGECYEAPEEGQPPGPGQCNEVYSVVWIWAFDQSNFVRVVTPEFAQGYPPFSLEILQPGEPDADGNTSVRPRARLQYRIEVNGELVNADRSYQSFSFANANGRGYPGWVRFCRGTLNAPALGNPLDSTGFGSLPSNAATDAGSDGSDYKCSAGTPADDCGFIPAYPPFCDADPQIWQSLASSNPPIRYSVDTNNDRSLVTVTDTTGEIARLDFLPNAYEIKTGCAEDGCD